METPGNLPLPIAVNKSQPQSAQKPNKEEYRLLRKELEKATSQIQPYELPWATSKSKNLNKLFPHLPEWANSRPYLKNYGALIISESSSTRKADLGTEDIVPANSLSPEQQELCIIEDLLFVMEGMNGKYIHITYHTGSKEEVQFTVDPNLDLSLTHLVQKMLPVSKYYMQLSAYVATHSRFEYGRVNHALCAAIREVIKEYLVLIAQLEHQLRQGKLSLQKLWFYIQPSLRTLEVLHKLTHEASNAVGGALMNCIYKTLLAMSGDEHTQNLLLFLMARASVPWFEMLQQWIYDGIIEDPFEEFCVEEHLHLQKENLNQDYNDTYWEQRYTMREDQLPVFLKRVADKALITGKYLNVIRECGLQIDGGVKATIEYTTDERMYQEKIEAAYTFASKRLLALLMEEKQLLPRLRSIKHYFLLDQGDFFVHFIDTAGDELRKQVQDVTLSKLNSLLELSLRTSIADADPYKDDLTCSLLPYNLLHQLLKIIHVADGAVHVNTAIVNQPQTQPSATHTASRPSSAETQANNTNNAEKTTNAEPARLTGLEAFTFDYKVSWPLSLVISRKALTKYQLIFRHLFLCKHVERQLVHAWQQHQSTNHEGTQLMKALTPSFRMRQRMVYFLQNLEYYMTSEVLEPNWHILEQNLKKVTTIDEVLKYHNDFLDTCLKECMLTDPNLVKILTRLMSICIMFASYTDRFLQTLKVDTESALGELEDSQEDQKTKRLTRIQVVSDQATKLMKDKGFVRTIQRFETNFNTTLKQLIDSLNFLSTTEANSQMANLVLRLDFNNFYKQYFHNNQQVTATAASFVHLRTPANANQTGTKT